MAQARSAHGLKVQGWLREEALEWGIRIDADIAAKEKDTEQVKQERQRDLIKLKVPCASYLPYCLHHPSAAMSLLIYFCTCLCLCTRHACIIATQVSIMHCLQMHSSSQAKFIVCWPLWDSCEVQQDQSCLSTCRLKLSCNFQPQV